MTKRKRRLCGDSRPQLSVLSEVEESGRAKLDMVYDETRHVP